ncbi:uncharacterized protein B0H64DRAFT_409730 [Chaetomium fimeti]|uniref:Uncharacterized protein n=1 Tax=Chaetomium fimeti TaxID=1854472 RepID=A0AAE0H809_9PEZI|nr:hypothetical protein B0H64DRAFT_409730 [Chaetomium fimeti]
MQANPEHEELYRRAATDPRSISRAERNAIWGHPPPEEEDRLCVAKTGHTRAGLVVKAIENKDELTLCEAQILCSGRSVNYDIPQYAGPPSLDLLETSLLQYLKEPTPLEKLRNEAVDQLSAVRSAEEVTAVTNATSRRRVFKMAEIEAREEKWREFERARRLKVGTPWMRGMLRDGLLEDGAECWGFVVFRTGCYHGDEGEAAWQRFRDYLPKVAATSILHWNSGPELQPSLRVLFVEDKELESASNEQLRAKFKKMRDGARGDHLPKGIRTNCFLVADEAVIESEAAQAPYTPRYTDDIEMGVEILDDDPVVYIRAVDPDYVAPAVPAEATTKETAGDITGLRTTPTSGNSSSVAPEPTNVGAKEAGDEMADFKGEATMALPRVFDWLHAVCFYAERGITPTWDARKGWHTVHVQTKKPEAWIRNWSPNSGGVEYIHVRRSAVPGPWQVTGAPPSLPP